MPANVRLQSLREQRGLSAAELARKVGVSRQSIYQIEDGSFLPNTAIALRLARTLEVTVEDLFSLEDEAVPPERVHARSLPGAEIFTGQPVKLCRVGERWIAVPAHTGPAYLPVSDGFVAEKTRTGVSVNAAPNREEEKRLLLAGCDPALSLLADHLRSSGVEIVCVSCSSRTALQWLKEGRVHVAGTHLLDRSSGEYNLPIIQRLVPEMRVRVVTFAMWEQGLVVMPGNPKGVRSVADLAQEGLRFINREKGSGSRQLLDARLREFEMDSASVNGYDSIASGHLAAARAVADGSADCCLATRAAARCCDLDFIPQTVQRFDLCFSSAGLDLLAGKAVLECLQHAQLRKKLQRIAGYDTAQCGTVLL